MFQSVMTEFAIDADACGGLSFPSSCHSVDLMCLHPNQKSIRKSVLFQMEWIPVHYVISNDFVTDIPWKKVWSLPHKY